MHFSYYYYYFFLKRLFSLSLQTVYFLNPEEKEHYAELNVPRDIEKNTQGPHVEQLNSSKTN